MFVTNDDRIIPLNVSLQTAVVVPASTSSISNSIRNIRIKFMRYNFIAMAIYVGLFAHLG
jgi:hypothetical protein